MRRYIKLVTGLRIITMKIIYLKRRLSRRQLLYGIIVLALVPFLVTYMGESFKILLFNLGIIFNM